MLEKGYVGGFHVGEVTFEQCLLEEDMSQQCTLEREYIGVVQVAGCPTVC
jgi:hypothetical protein